jgi:ubiquinone/menaquinone biosynthesis C-methylase UbiE
MRKAGRPVFAVDLSPAMAALAARHLDGAVVADMVQLPFAPGSISDIVAFYSLIHLPRARITDALREFARVLGSDGHALISAHEGTTDVAVSEFLGHEVDLHASFFTLTELTQAAASADLAPVLAERRPPYPNEGSTTRIYLELAKR